MLSGTAISVQKAGVSNIKSKKNNIINECVYFFMRDKIYILN